MNIHGDILVCLVSLECCFKQIDQSQAFSVSIQAFTPATARCQTLETELFLPSHPSVAATSASCSRCGAHHWIVFVSSLSVSFNKHAQWSIPAPFCCIPAGSQGTSHTEQTLCEFKSTVSPTTILPLLSPSELLEVGAICQHREQVHFPE